jgi:hypothetical protein
VHVVTLSSRPETQAMAPASVGAVPESASVVPELAALVPVPVEALVVIAPAKLLLDPPLGGLLAELLVAPALAVVDGGLVTPALVVVDGGLLLLQPASVPPTVAAEVKRMDAKDRIFIAVSSIPILNVFWLFMSAEPSVRTAPDEVQAASSKNPLSHASEIHVELRGSSEPRTILPIRTWFGECDGSFEWTSRLPAASGGIESETAILRCMYALCTPAALSSRRHGVQTL